MSVSRPRPGASGSRQPRRGGGGGSHGAAVPRFAAELGGDQAPRRPRAAARDPPVPAHLPRRQGPAQGRAQVGRRGERPRPPPPLGAPVRPPGAFFVRRGAPRGPTVVRVLRCASRVPGRSVPALARRASGEWGPA